LYKTDKKVVTVTPWSRLSNVARMYAVVVLRLGEPEAKLKRGALWWRHHTRPTVISTFDQAQDTATVGHVPDW